jgi:hypothetical protein
MQTSSLAFQASVSPHKLFQALWAAIEAGDCDDVPLLVDALRDMMKDRQTLAVCAVRELIHSAKKRACPGEIMEALTRMPGYEAEAD